MAKKKKKTDKIKEAIKDMQGAMENAMDEYLKFKKGNMSAAARSRSAIQFVSKNCKEVRKMIQEKKNKRIEKKKG